MNVLCHRSLQNLLVVATIFFKSYVPTAIIINALKRVSNTVVKVSRNISIAYFHSIKQEGK